MIDMARTVVRTVRAHGVSLGVSKTENWTQHPSDVGHDRHRTCSFKRDAYSVRLETIRDRPTSLVHG